MGGAAGGGKSRTLVAAMAYLNILYAQHGNVYPVTALATTDSGSVKDRFGQHIQEMLVRTGLGQIRGATKDETSGFVFDDKRFGIIKFVSLHRGLDPRGKAPWAMGIDELTLLPEMTWINVFPTVRFKGRTSAKGTGRNPLPFSGPIICGSNPIGEHAYWVHEYFVEKTFNTKLGQAAENRPDDYCFIPITLKDNPDEEFQRDYEHKLQALPEVQRNAFLHGIWDIRKGLRFPTLPDNQNETLEPPSHWLKFGGVDYGYSDESAIVWGAIDEDGVLHVYDELITPEKSANEIADICRRSPARWFACDTTMWGRESSGNTIIQAWKGVNVRRGTNHGHPGNLAIERRIRSGKLVIHGCPTLYRCLSGVSWGKAPKHENLEPHELTHGVYALGYLCESVEGLKAEPPPREKTEYESWFEARIKASEYKREYAKRNFLLL